MRQRYLIVKYKDGNYQLLTSTEWATLENQEDYEVLAICDGLNNVKQYIEKSTSYKVFSVNVNNINQFIEGCMLLPIGTEVYQFENNKILTYNVESIKICDYNRDDEDNISERNGKYDIEYGLVRYYIPFGCTRQYTSRLTLTHANLNKYLFLSKEELYKSMEE